MYPRIAAFHYTSSGYTGIANALGWHALILGWYYGAAGDHWAWSEDQMHENATYNEETITYSDPTMTYNGLVSDRDPGAWDIW